MKRTKKEPAALPDFKLMAHCAAALAAGVDPIEIYKYADEYAFDPATERLAEIYRRHKARQAARPRKAGEVRP